MNGLGFKKQVIIKSPYGMMGVSEKGDFMLTVQKENKRNILHSQIKSLCDFEKTPCPQYNPDYTQSYSKNWEATFYTLMDSVENDYERRAVLNRLYQGGLSFSLVLALNRQQLTKEAYYRLVDYTEQIGVSVLLSEKCLKALGDLHEPIMVSLLNQFKKQAGDSKCIIPYFDGNPFHNSQVFTKYLYAQEFFDTYLSGASHWMNERRSCDGATPIYNWWKTFLSQEVVLQTPSHFRIMDEVSIQCLHHEDKNGVALWKVVSNAAVRGAFLSLEVPFPKTQAFAEELRLNSNTSRVVAVGRRLARL